MLQWATGCPAPVQQSGPALGPGKRVAAPSAELVTVSQYDYCLNLCTMTFLNFCVCVFPTGTVNKSNVVTASTSIQLLDERKSPVVAGKQWILITDYKPSSASTYLASQLLLGTRKLVFKGKKKLITPSSAWCHLLQSKALAAGCI